MKATKIFETGGPEILKLAELPISQPGRVVCMVRILSAILLLLLLPHAALARASQQGPVVHVSSGVLRGYVQGNISVFKGIPFAAPPVGNLRWRAPQPVAAWKGVRDATKSANSCVQAATGIGPFIQPLAAAYGATYIPEQVTSSEDCLYLNVWAPQGAAQRPLPVMVWLHGGSNRNGSGSQSAYDGSSLAEHGVIVVTVNYRLGVLGFFSHPELTAESPHRSSGNYGLLDQLAALEWVQKNIAQFGGAPQTVTLFGESAGAIDAGMLVTSPLSAHLFQRVILESGPAFGLGAIHTLAEAEAAGAALGRAAPGSSKSALENLRKLPAGELMRIASAQSNGSYDASSIMDGWVLPRSPAVAFATGSIQKVDMMVGLNGRELSAFRVVAAAMPKPAGEQKKSGGALDGIEKLADAARPLYGMWTYAAIGKYIGQAFIHRDLAIDQAGNDMLLACPIGAMAVLTEAAGQKVYVYKFERAVPGKGEAELGAFHSIELPYVFNTFQDRIWRWLPFTDADYRLSREIESYWTNFAKTGNPNGADLPGWPAWKDGAEDYMDFTRNAEAAAEQHFSPAFCSLSAGRLRKGLTDGK
jgi:para-nitrobenzyl esterase